MKLGRVIITAEKLRRCAAAALTAAVGLVLLAPVGDGWITSSYDWLFHFRPYVDVSKEDVVIVEMDAESEKAFGQIPILAWDRSLHAELLTHLTTQKVNVVAFDVLFEDRPGIRPAGDQKLLRAAKEHARVVFGAVQIERTAPDGQKAGPEISRSFPKSIPLEQNGLVEHSFGDDRAIHQHFHGAMGLPSLAWRVAELAMANPPEDRGANRWINFYGPPEQTIPHVSFWRVLSNAVPPSINFSNKVVFVGARTTIGPTAGSGTEYFPTPFRARVTGVELNATTYLNLFRRDWLTRWPLHIEGWCLALLGGLAGWCLCGRKPGRALGLATLLAALVFGFAVALFWQQHFWFPWLIIIGAQLPVALASAIFFYKASPLPARPSEERLAGATTVVPQGSASGGASSVPAIPDHQLFRCVGRGAYGEVWLAKDVIGTFHAVKLVYRSSFRSDAPFEREFKGMQKYTPISRNHPGWVHVLHVGKNEAGGYFFYIMEAGDDETTGQEIDPATYQPRTLAREIERRRRLPIDESLAIGIGLADALDYLHGQLLIHRDIKPSNVIFVHGQPKFTDVGLVTDVKNRDRDVSLLGTEGYIAPEGPGTAGADVYSLGKLLYECSTGRDRLEFPVMPESLAEETNAAAQGSLGKILQKACAEDPLKRYQSASELQEALKELQRSLATTPGEN